MSSQVQSVTFPRASFSTRQAMHWLKQHDFKPIKKVDKTASRLRYRLVEPDQFGHFATKKVKEDIELIIGFPPHARAQKDPFPASSQRPSPGQPKGRKRDTTWIMHVKAFRTAHPGISYKEALLGASSTWKKV